ncbi:MAG: hypothetical protein JWQ00_1144 [Noviherbaspirillum sp.]|nr:hypothetical protein [Noviherbaspirillum sp.]
MRGAPRHGQTVNYGARLLSYWQCLLHCRHCTYHFMEEIMGKYFIAWLLGVPAIVLVLLYFFFR